MQKAKNAAKKKHDRLKKKVDFNLIYFAFRASRSNFYLTRKNKKAHSGLAFSAIEAHINVVDLVEFGFRLVGAAPILFRIFDSECVAPSGVASCLFEPWNDAGR